MGTVSTAMHAWDTHGLGCRHRYYKYYILGLLPVIAVPLINGVLQTVLKMLVKFEKHHTVR